MELGEILEKVPEYREFYTVDELHVSSETLVKEFPKEVRRISLGRSAGGEEISALSIGRGSLRAVLVGRFCAATIHK